MKRLFKVEPIVILNRGETVRKLYMGVLVLQKNINETYYVLKSRYYDEIVPSTSITEQQLNAYIANHFEDLI